MKKIKIIILLFFFPLLAISQQMLKIKDAVDMAMQENHNIKIARNNIKIAENNASLMNSGYLPNVSANSSVSDKNQDTYTDLGGGLERRVDNATTNAYNYGISLNYRLFDGMGRHYTNKISKSSLGLAELQARAVIENTLMDLIISYYEVAKLSSKLENQKRTTEISNERYRRTKMKFDFGQATKLDLLRSEVDRNNDSINLINTNRELQVSRHNLNVILARDVNTEFTVDTNVVFQQSLNADTLIKLSLQQNVDYIISTKNVEIAELDRKSQKTNYIPKLDISGGYAGSNVTSTGGAFLANEAYGYNLTASLNWNIFDGGQTHTRIQNAKISELNAKESSYNRKIELMREVSNAFINYKNSIFIMKAEQKNRSTNELNFKYSNEQFLLGQISSIDYRKAQVDLEESINRYNEAKYSAKIAELQLMKLAGLFMKEL
jgi:outer membrane protein TolC